jgi:hypothetical protein
MLRNVIRSEFSISDIPPRIVISGYMLVADSVLRLCSLGEIPVPLASFIVASGDSLCGHAKKDRWSRAVTRKPYIGIFFVLVESDHATVTRPAPLYFLSACLE